MVLDGGASGLGTGAGVQNLKPPTLSVDRPRRPKRSRRCRCRCIGLSFYGIFARRLFFRNAKNWKTVGSAVYLIVFFLRWIRILVRVVDWLRRSSERISLKLGNDSSRRHRRRPVVFEGTQSLLHPLLCSLQRDLFPVPTRRVQEQAALQEGRLRPRPRIHHTAHYCAWIPRDRSRAYLS